jgi:hypothetical protein
LGFAGPVPVTTWVRAKKAPTEIDWSGLSEEAAWTIVHIAWPIRCGLSTSEVAAQVGKTNCWVTKRLSALRRQPVRLSG